MRLGAQVPPPHDPVPTRAFLGASLILNAVLFYLLLAQPRCPASVTPVDVSRGNDATQEAPGEGAQKPGLVQAWSEDVFEKLLERAEAAYQKHKQLRSELIGSEVELSYPFPEEAHAAMDKAHPFLQGRWAHPVYSREYLLTPRYPCFEEVRVGAWGEGGKWVCLESLHKKADDLVVYSVGSQGDTGFEKGIFELLGATSHTFDPFVPADRVAYMSTLPFVVFRSFGLAGSEGEVVTNAETKAQVQGKTLQQMMAEFGHTFIDLLKVDCEGCEISFVNGLAGTTTRDAPLFGQILMEIHNLEDMTRESTLLMHLRNLGFRMFHSEVNFFDPKNVFEVAFIHESVVQPKKKPAPE